MGVEFTWEQTIYLVLLSLPKSYDQFVENFHMTNIDVTLIDVTQMLMAVEAEMLKNTNKVEMLIGSNTKVFMDIDNGNIGDQEKISHLN